MFCMEDKNLFLLNIYWEEWKFRQENLWKRIIQFYVIIFFVSTLPITVKVFDRVDISFFNYLLTFPIAGLLLTLFFLWFCLSESSRINSVDDKIKKIINDNYPEKYQKSKLIPFTKKSREAGKETFKCFQWRMAIWVPIFLSVTQTIISVTIFILIITGKIN